MPVMEVTLQQSYASQEIINRWTYLASGTPAAVSFSFALISAMGAIESGGVYPAGGLMALLAACQSSQVSFVQIGARDVYSVTDFYETPFIVNLNGSRTGEPLSPINALGFRTNRTRTDIRRATKRFTGISENDVSSFGSLQGAFVTGQAAPLGAKMSEVLEYDDEGNTLSFAPIVCGKEKYAVPGSSPVRYAYRYYPTEEDQLDHIMESIAWDNYPEVRSQVSRQFGRGR